MLIHCIFCVKNSDRIGRIKSMGTICLILISEKEVTVQLRANSDLSGCCAEMQRVVQREQGTGNREQEKPRTDRNNVDRGYVPATKTKHGIPENPVVASPSRAREARAIPLLPPSVPCFFENAMAAQAPPLQFVHPWNVRGSSHSCSLFPVPCSLGRSPR